MIAYLYLATLYLAGRLICLNGNGPRSLIWFVAATAIQILATAPIALHSEMGCLWVLLLFMALPVLVGIAAVIDCCARNCETLRLALRIGTLLFGLLIIGILAKKNSPEGVPEFHRIAELATEQLAFGFLIAEIKWVKVLALALGLLLCLLESSHVVRLSLKLMRVQPPESNAAKFKHSAEIGAIERVLIYFFVYHGAFNAVAFVLTAKTVARVHELTNSEAAEYVLLGTLTSTLVSMAVALLVGAILPMLNG